MEENERLQEIERVEGLISDLPNREKREIEVNSELREAVLNCFIAERILRTSDRLLRDFQLAVEEKKNGFLDRHRTLQAELDRLEREQGGSTSDLIERGIKKLREALQEVKLEEFSNGRAASGFDGPKLNISSNRTAILKARSLVNSATEILKTMCIKPVAQIEEFIEAKLGELREINFLPSNQVVAEADYNRTQFLERPKEL
jgi:hypothetical protein